jgi:hypothetical protein
MEDIMRTIQYALGLSSIIGSLMAQGEDIPAGDKHVTLQYGS